MILIHLLLKRAVSPELATKIETSPTVQNLLKQDNIAKVSGSKFHLTEVGEMIAKGALSTYPETIERFPDASQNKTN